MRLEWLQVLPALRRVECMSAAYHSLWWNGCPHCHASLCLLGVGERRCLRCGAWFVELTATDQDQTIPNAVVQRGEGEP